MPQARKRAPVLCSSAIFTLNSPSSLSRSLGARHRLWLLVDFNVSKLTFVMHQCQQNWTIVAIFHGFKYFEISLMGYIVVLVDKHATFVNCTLLGTTLLSIFKRHKDVS
jgi:hypothetical protein